MSGSSLPDRWLVASIPKPADPIEGELLVEALRDLAPRGVEELDDRFIVYLPEPEGGESALRVDIARRLAGVFGPEPPVLDLHWQAHEAWEETWRRGIEPRRVTPRILVTPSWADPPAEEGALLITIDPGMAFGTAEHPTTRGSLRLLDGALAPGERIADIGAGSGILSIAAARLGAASVLAVELDEWSCTTARENLALNGVEDRVEVRHIAVGPDFLPDEAPFDGILANIESGILESLLRGFASGLRSGGWLILSGILEDEVASIVAAAAEEGFELEREDREGGWWSGRFRGP